VQEFCIPIANSIISNDTCILHNVSIQDHVIAALVARVTEAVDVPNPPDQLEIWEGLKALSIDTVPVIDEDRLFPHTLVGKPLCTAFGFGPSTGNYTHKLEVQLTLAFEAYGTLFPNVVK
jgi:hypothetical protein